MFILMSLVLTLASPARSESAPEARVRMLDLTARVAHDGLRRGLEVDRRAYDVNAAAWAELFRTIGTEAGVTGLWLELSDHRYVFPQTTMDVPAGVVPMLVARQTRIFSWLAWRAAELKHGRARHQDWRADFFGRSLDKLRADLEHELFEYAHRRYGGDEYAAAELRGLLAVANEVARLTPYAAVRQTLRQVSRVPAGRGFTVTPPTLRRSLVQALGFVHAAVDQRDEIACTTILTN